jgi:hypothetical protein
MDGIVLARVENSLNGLRKDLSPQGTLWAITRETWGCKEEEYTRGESDAERVREGGREERWRDAESVVKKAITVAHRDGA